MAPRDWSDETENVGNETKEKPVIGVFFFFIQLETIGLPIRSNHL